MVRYSILLLTFLISYSGFAKKYYVYLADKNGQNLNPNAYFDSKAIARRQKCNIPLVQFTDLPVRIDYIAKVKGLADSITVTSRWFNMICVFANESQIDKIASLSFVDRVEEAVERSRLVSSVHTESTGFANLLNYQTERMEGSLFTKNNIKGQNVCIAVLDAGFTSSDEHKSLGHLKIKAAYDFVGKDDNPYHGSTHGTSVLSVIGGLYKDTLMGLAPDASYLLARTERHHHEFESEEENWLAAAEWADKNGADVINSSLGYTNNRYFLSEMDGSSLVAKAANMAFSKGIVVVCSAGNDGENSWKYVGTPADAEDVLAIGGINPYTDTKIDFSSFGPNANGRTKPNVCASGTTFSCSTGQSYSDVDGTSFSSPLVAGFVACLIQANPELNHRDIFELVEKSGHLYPYFDYAHGYGIPLASKALNMPTKQVAFFKVEELNGRQIVLAPADSLAKDTCTSADFLDKNYFVKVQTKSGKIVFYKVSTPFGFYSESWPTLLNGNEVGSALKPNEEYEIFVHFEGFTQMIKIKWP